MSYINSFVTMLFGGASGGDQPARSAGANAQRIAEKVAAVTRRMFKGPQRNGHFSLEVFVDAINGPTSATGLTLWYSNLLNPSLSNDNDWVQDTSVEVTPIIVLTATGKAFINVGNVNAEHIMVKADVTAGDVDIRVFVRSEGVEV